MNTNKLKVRQRSKQRSAVCRWKQQQMRGVNRPRLILVVAAGIGLLSAVGVSRVEVDTYSIDFLYDDHPARVDSARLEAGFGPYTPLEFVVHNEDTVKTPEILAAMSRWQTKMEADTDVGWTRSLADVVENLDRVLMARPEGRIPCLLYTSPSPRD